MKQRVISAIIALIIVVPLVILGGIPYYLKMLNAKYSLAQNVDELFFRDSALLEDEFENLYASLFRNSADYGTDYTYNE